MKHDGIQEECSDEEHEQTVSKQMTQNSDVKAEKTRPVRQKAVQDGTLATGTLQRVQNMLENMQGESAKMAEDLVNAQQSCVIGPSVITNCTEAKTQFDAAVTELQTYKDNNKELDTATVLKDAKQKLLDSRKQFNIVRKILSLKCPVSQPRDVGIGVEI